MLSSDSLHHFWGKNFRNFILGCSCDFVTNLNHMLLCNECSRKQFGILILGISGKAKKSLEGGIFQVIKLENFR